MAERFLDLSPGDRREVFTIQADRLGRTAFVLEKDLWVCWVLERLFAMPGQLKMAFKGGTSLSKVYQAIDRFSEDVDITLEYRALWEGFGTKAFPAGFDPLNPGTSRSQRDKFMAALKDALKTRIQSHVLPYFHAQLAQECALGAGFAEIDPAGEKIRIQYPSVFEAHGYLQQSVLIEFGGRNLTEPNERHTVRPFVAEGLPMVDFPVAEVTVLSPSRTFWEKATLIHAECGRATLERSVARLSRHWYDLALLADHWIGAKAMGEDLGLFRDVVAHKRVFSAAGHAHYEACLAGGIRLVPGEPLLRELQADYQGMQDMIYGQPLAFQEMMQRLRSLESRINGLANGALA